MSFVHFHPRVPTKLDPITVELMRRLRAQIGDDFAYDDTEPYARLFVREVSREYAGHVFKVCQETDWVGAFSPVLGDYELVATSAYRPSPETAFVTNYGVTGEAIIVRSADETLEAIAPAFEDWCALGEIEPGQNP